MNINGVLGKTLDVETDNDPTIMKYSVRFSQKNLITVGKIIRNRYALSTVSEMYKTRTVSYYFYSDIPTSFVAF
jgi:hypothetical protein